MEVADKNQFLTTFKFLCKYFKQSFDEELFEFYWNILQKYPFMYVKKALYRYVEIPVSGRYFPKICDISERIKEMQKSATRQTKKTWEEELKELKADLRHWKRYEHAAEENNYLKICIANCENKIKEHLEKKEKI